MADEPKSGEVPVPEDADAASPEDRSRVRISRRSNLPDVEGTELVHGRKAGTVYARRVREGERKFEKGDAEGTFRATERATAPRTGAERLWQRVRRVFVGNPIATEEQEEQRLPKWKALAVFSSDALSSSAYATDEILLVLALGGLSLAYSIPIALAICTLLAIVTFSYRQTIRAYPSGGGAYIVARDNLGDVAGLTAAAGLSVGYILTVAVSIAAGVFAVSSAFPELDASRDILGVSIEMKVLLAAAAVGVITILNLRGISESGTIFAIPTYGFILAFGTMIIAGFVRIVLDPDLRAEPLESWEHTGTTAFAWFIILRAFASGSAALTGVEAISNGIPAFQKPEPRNAATTLMMMALILGTLFFCVTFLANQFDIQHSKEISAPAQIAKTVFGETPIFYLIQAFTALILFLAANTAYADFPRLGSILARDRFLPHQFLFRGDRLAFSFGIWVLGITSVVLLVIFNASVNRLIPLYAFGVFLSFTLSQSGMIRHWLKVREPGWKPSIVINTVGAATTGVVAVIVGSTNFVAGAWISMVMIAVVAVLLWAVYRHYTDVEEQLQVPEDAIFGFGPEARHRQAVLVPVDEINHAVLRTVDYARSISPNVTALHITDDLDNGQELRREWNRRVMDIEMVLINSPYRSFVRPVLSYIDALDKADPGQYVTVVLPEFRTPFPWQRFLHNQSARRLKNALLERPNTVIVEVPYHLGGARLTTG